jgi:putative endonuclease
MKTRERGRWGEERAARFLKKKKYRILTSNYTSRYGEIDIIAQCGDTIVFVEVKTRSVNTYGRPGEAVDIRKQQKMIKTAMTYIQEKELDKQDMGYRFDIIEIIYNDRDVQIQHIENAFGIDPA